MRGDRFESTHDLPKTNPEYLVLEEKDAMDVIGHDDEGTKGEMRESLGKFLPGVLHHLPTGGKG